MDVRRGGAGFEDQRKSNSLKRIKFWREREMMEAYRKSRRAPRPCKGRVEIDMETRESRGMVDGTACQPSGPLVSSSTATGA